MKPLQQLLILLFLLASSSQALASDIPPWPTPKLVKSADLIVVGEAVKERDKMVVRVSEVLKGKAGEWLVLSRVKAGRFEQVLIQPGNKGVFFLVKDGAEYSPFTWGCYQSMDHVAAVRTAIKLVADPGPFLDVTKFPESTDIIYVLGEQFTRWNLTSKEIPALKWDSSTFYEVAPWNDKRVVTLQCKTDPKNGFRVSVTSAEPMGPLSECLKYRLSVGEWRWSSVRRNLPARFSVTLDARLPERAGSATVEKSKGYLRERLKSTDVEIVLAALLALATMRDLDAVLPVLQLLNHSDQKVRGRAIEFLGWSRDQRAIKPLHAMLNAVETYPEGDPIPDTVAQALGRIGHKESLTVLERGARIGLERSIEAVGSWGDTKSFETMLTALERNPERCSQIDFALYWLVRRSNKDIEPWMTESSTTQAIRIARIPRWRAWWDLHKKDFRVIRTQEEEIYASIQAD